MPIIVPIEENKVGLATATDAKFRAPDTSGSGLEALGAGLTQLGGGAQQLASGIEERRRRAAEAIAAAMLDDRHQSNIDDAAVKNAYVDYSDLTHDALHGDDGLFNRQGADAHAAFPGVVEKLVDNHDKSLSKLDDVQRAAVAPSMNERLRSDVGRAAEHVRQQGAVEQKWQSEELQRAAARDALNHADDPALFDHHLATGENAIRQQAKIDNIGDKLLARQIVDYRSRVHADTIAGLAQRDPVHAAGWYARYGSNLNELDASRVGAALDSVGTDGPDAAHQTDQTLGTNSALSNEVDFTDAGEPVPVGEAYSANEAEEAPAENSAADPSTFPGASQEPDEVPPYEKPPRSPMPLSIGMKPSPEMRKWLEGFAPTYRYSLNEPTDFITRFRARNPEFVRLERENFEKSKISPSWFSSRRERTLLVYQSVTDPRQYKIRTVVGEANITHFYDDHGNPLPFGQLPEKQGFRLIIAEHTHPRPVETWRLGSAAQRGPSNADIAYAWLNPDVHFVIKSVYSYDTSHGSADEEYYYGAGFHGQGFHP